jgi:choline-sulfatase
MGAYGNKEIRTPHMDRIGREGAVFTNAFVATPVCSPSRATYLAGRFPSELGITDWIAPVEADAGLGLKGVTWPQVLQRNGYRTGLVGKWHLGTQSQYHPTKLGFHHFMGFLAGGNRPMNPTLEVDGKETQLKGPLPDLLVDDAVQFVRNNKEMPFALCLHFRAPHLPYGPVPEVDSQPYKDLDPDVPVTRGAVESKQIKQWNRDYYASITSIDRNVGRLLAALDELKLSDNTIVLFTSDHGYNNGRHGVNTKGNGHWIAGGVNGPKRPNMWDTSIRVPLVVRWPGVVKPGTKIDSLVSNVDMFRTVLGALDVPLPREAESKVRGVDFSRCFAANRLRNGTPCSASTTCTTAGWPTCG